MHPTHELRHTHASPGAHLGPHHEYCQCFVQLYVGLLRSLS